jgi:Flp pilus assembly protein TadG
MRRLRNEERGASLVEFALIFPLLILVLFGIMEAGWAFSQSVEVRNAAREGARLAVVDFGDAAAVITETCNRADLSGSGATVAVTINGADESVTVDVSQAYNTLTGLLDSFFGGLSLDSSVEMRVERSLDNLTANGSGACP